ncbi:hypothetical protein HCY58_10970 [Acinetobacter radioresistens]|uniref:hypothetical protein n=1 Tax=Acinetobacter radioresistens TaxID=40216 RepID=UPI002002C414|nr:hypothetical protein [Acinetobacter radioresistens]MCK4087569.1 hypothetical protein [Acinetobacter radioresistens]
MKKIILLALLVGLVGCGPQPERKLKSKEETKVEVLPDYKWNVQSYHDEMRETTSKWLYLRSENSANFGFPYEGENHLTLYVLDSKTKNPTILLEIDNGQYHCDLDRCYATVKFGKNPVQYLTFYKVDNNDKLLRFTENTKAFLNNIRNMNSIIIELPFFQEGDVQFKFDTKNFNKAETELISENNEKNI